MPHLPVAIAMQSFAASPEAVRLAVVPRWRRLMNATRVYRCYRQHLSVLDSLRFLWFVVMWKPS
jgi:hypothetical protein